VQLHLENVLAVLACGYDASEGSERASVPYIVVVPVLMHKEKIRVFVSAYDLCTNMGMRQSFV